MQVRPPQQNCVQVPVCLLKFSFIDEVVTKFQRIDTYAGNDIKRLYDSSSNSSPKKREIKNKKSTLKSMKDENFEEYIKKIEKVEIFV